MIRRLAEHWLEAVEGDGMLIVRFQRHTILEETSVRMIEEELQHLVEEHDCRQLLLNFDGVSNLSSYVLGSLMRLNLRLRRQQGGLALCNLDPKLEQVFKDTRLDRTFPIYRDEEAARNALQGTS